MNVIEQSTLYFKEGGSDKVYHAQINAVDGGFTVTFSYGRRGSALKDGAKTNAPVPREQATRIFSKLVSVKQAKGYTPGEDAAPFDGLSSYEDSKIRCQLLNVVDEQDVDALLADSQYCAQEKYDGERRLIARVNGVIRGINRKGLYIALSTAISNDVANLAAGDFVLDGEQVGDLFLAFDILVSPTQGDVRSLPYSERLTLLSDLLLRRANDEVVKLAPVAFAPATKLALFSSVRARNGEGVVFKDCHAAYSSGRPSSGGAQLKYKFTESCSVQVNKVNGDRRSVSVSAYGAAGQVVPLGNVTIPPNHTVPSVGDVVEVRYLYAFPGGSLFQPIYLGSRNDIDASECLVSQLKYKPETADCGDAG